LVQETLCCQPEQQEELQVWQFCLLEAMQQQAPLA